MCASRTTCDSAAGNILLATKTKSSSKPTPVFFLLEGIFLDFFGPVNMMHHDKSQRMWTCRWRSGECALCCADRRLRFGHGCAQHTAFCGWSQRIWAPEKGFGQVCVLCLSTLDHWTAIRLTRVTLLLNCQPCRCSILMEIPYKPSQLAGAISPELQMPLASFQSSTADLLEVMCGNVYIFLDILRKV